jgi:tetratricopeptide (TPR) repeat protein
VELSQTQRDLLLGLVENDNGFWECGNALSLLTERGLPSMRDEMAALLGVTFTHDPAKAALRSAELFLHTFRDVERALEDVERALHHDPKLGRAHLVKGFCLLHKDDVEGALASFKSAIPFVIGDELVLARKNTSTLLGQLGQREEGLPYLEQNVEEFPSSADAWYDLGLSLVKAGHYDRCIAAIERALQLRPRHANSHYTVACAFALRKKAGDIERALEAIQRAVEIHPEVRESIRDDEDFEAMRDDPRFIALVAD